MRFFTSWAKSSFLVLLLLGSHSILAQARRVSEADLRRLQLAQPQNEMLSQILDAVTFLRGCGLRGELVRVNNIPAPSAFKDWTGLYFMLEAIETRNYCNVGPFALLSSTRVRERLQRLVSHPAHKVLLSLMVNRPFYARVADPSTNSAARALADHLGFDQEIFFFIGKSALVEEVDDWGSLANQGLAEDLMELLSLRMTNRAS